MYDLLVQVTRYLISTWVHDCLRNKHKAKSKYNAVCSVDCTKKKKKKLIRNESMKWPYFEAYKLHSLPTLQTFTPPPITLHPIQWWSHLESILGPTSHPSLMIQTSLERIYMVYYQCSNRVHPMQHKIWSSWWITDFLAFLDKIWSTHLRIKNCKILILDNYLLFIFKLNWGKRLMCIEHT